MPSFHTNFFFFLKKTGKSKKKLSPACEMISAKNKVFMVNFFPTLKGFLVINIYIMMT